MFKAFLEYNDGKLIALSPNKMTYEEELYVDFKIEEQDNGRLISLTMHPKEDITIKRVWVELDFQYTTDHKIFCNGFQSWTESREFERTERFTGLKPFANFMMKYYGDYHFENIKYEQGSFHSWTYTYIRTGYKKMLFLGALNEHTGYTIFRHKIVQNKLLIEKDCSDLSLSHSYPVFELWYQEGEDKTVFDLYFKKMNTVKPKAKPAIGWTSWYHYYTDISERIIQKNLEAFKKRAVPVDIFQIDDGYQTKVGDWLSIKPSFPRGMKAMANEIHHKGYKAGLWLAPFVCESKSDIFKNKKHWLLKDEKGDYVKAGYTPLWSGWFYALDFYNKEVQDYLSGVFHTVLEKWGFDMVKLDFLYAVALIKRPNKTRGQIMHESMTFLRNLVGEKLILGCGVPLGACFGLVDYCRIGADIHLKWEHRLLKFLGNRERVSTIIALRSVLGRWQLNERAFQSDPDVFILRKEKNKLTEVQQDTILLINTLLGNVIFTSDYLGDYDEEQWSEYQSIYKWMNSEIVYVVQVKDIYQIEFKNNGVYYVAICNLGKQKGNSVLNSRQIVLEPYESMVLKDNSKNYIGLEGRDRPI